LQPTFAPPIAFELWKQGFGLHAAALRIAPPELRERYSLPAPQILVKPVAGTPPAKSFWDVLGAIAEALPQLKPLTDHWSQQNAALQRMRDLVVGYLVRKDLTAFGYILPRGHEDAPVAIPTDVWGGQIDWKQSTVSGNGLQFVAVTVVATNAIPNLIVRLLPAPEAKPKTPRGRRPVKAFVLEAYDRLKAGKAIDFSMPMVESFDAIRELLRKMYPERAGQFEALADETLRKHITALFQADRDDAIQ
jgi:hypothetical protein